MHSLLIIAETRGNSIPDILEPFDENHEVEEYCVGEVPENERQHFLDYYNDHTPGYHFSMEQFDELYKAKGQDWNNNRWRKGEDGIWKEYSTYNPDSLWDWYEVGGRWAANLQLKEGVEPMLPVHFSWGWKEEEKKKVLEMEPKRADIAYLGDIANLDTLKAACVIKDGELIDLSDGFYFGDVAPVLAGMPDDTVIICIDYHI